MDLLQKKKLSGVGRLFGVPSQAWRVDDTVYALNLFGGEINLEGLVFDVTTGEVLFYAGPSRYGDLKVALVVPEKGVLLENYTWGAPSARGSVGLSLFDLTDGAGRRTHKELPSCLVRLPPHAYEWRFVLRREGVVLQAKIEKPGLPLAPSPNPTPTPPPSAFKPPPRNAPERPPPAPARASPGLKDRANGVTAELAETKLPKSCRALTDALLN